MIITGITGSSCTYRFVTNASSDDKEVLYQGRAVAYPGETGITITTDVLRNYITYKWELSGSTTDTFVQPDLFKYYGLEIYDEDNDTWNLFTSISPSDLHYVDIAYNVNHNSAPQGDSAGTYYINNPITGRVGNSRLRIPDNLSMTVTDAGAPVTSWTEYYFTMRQAFSSCPSGYTVGGRETSGGTHTGLICHDYSLYYVDTRGHLEYFLLEGECKSTGKLSQYSYGFSETLRRSADGVGCREMNSLPFASELVGGTQTYLTEMRDSWELVTGWLTDDQAARLCTDLIPSRDIWLVYHPQVLPKAELPNITEYWHKVRITDTNFKFKTYRNEGAKLVNYTINVEGTRIYDFR